MLLHLLRLRLSGRSSSRLVQCAGCGLSQRLDVGHKRVQLFIAHQTLKSRHHRLETGNDLGGWIQDRFAHIILIRDDGAPVFKQDRLAEYALQVWPPAPDIQTMTSSPAPRFRE